MGRNNVVPLRGNPRTHPSRTQGGGSRRADLKFGHYMCCAERVGHSIFYVGILK